MLTLARAGGSMLPPPPMSFSEMAIYEGAAYCAMSHFLILEANDKAMEF